MTNDNGRAKAHLAADQDNPPLVSVIIPVYNGDATLGETLLSARAQTYPAMEIIVVDDGSADRSIEIVNAQADLDPRVRLVRQSNSGVAAARNRGVEESKGEYIALLDADDLWRPSKIAKQMAVMMAADDRTAAVYSWCCLIDDEGRILDTGARQPFEGDVFERMCRRDLLGNGSVLLVRKDAYLDVGGCDTTICCEGVRGADDVRLHLALAERFHFGLVPEELTGYRLRKGSASEQYGIMIDLYRQAVAPFRAAHPKHAHLMDTQGKELMQWYCGRALHNRNLSGAVDILLRLGRLDPAFALYSMVFVTLRPLLWLFRRTRSGVALGYWSDPQTQGPSAPA